MQESADRCGVPAYDARQYARDGVCSGSPEPDFLGARTRRDEVRWFFHRRGQIVQSAMSVTGREFWLRVPRGFLERLQVDSGASAQRQVRMAERVEVGVFRPVRPFHGVSDARGFQVNAEHFRPSVVPRPGSAPELRFQSLPGGVITEFIRHVDGHRLHLQPARFVELCVDRGLERGHIRGWM